MSDAPVTFYHVISQREQVMSRLELFSIQLQLGQTIGGVSSFALTNN